MQYHCILFSMIKTYMVIFRYCSGLNTPPRVFTPKSNRHFPNVRKSQQHTYYIHKILWSQFYPAHKQTPQIHCADLNPTWCISSAACPHFRLCPAPVLSHQGLCRSIRAAAASHTHLQLAPIGKHSQAAAPSRGAPGLSELQCPQTVHPHAPSIRNPVLPQLLRTHHGCSSNADCLMSPGQAMWAFTELAINACWQCRVITGVGSPPRLPICFTHNTTLCLDLYPNFKSEHTKGLLNCCLLLESLQDQSRWYSGEQEF